VGDPRDDSQPPGQEGQGRHPHEPRAVPGAAPQRKGKGKEHAASPTGCGGGGEFDGDTSTAEQIFGENLVWLNEHVSRRLRVNKCQVVLREVTKLPQSHWFHPAVDWRALNLLDYPSVVRRPMDLFAVKLHVETGQVVSLDEFKDAVLLRVPQRHGLQHQERQRPCSRTSTGPPSSPSAPCWRPRPRRLRRRQASAPRGHKPVAAGKSGGASRAKPGSDDDVMPVARRPSGGIKGRCSSR